MFEDLFGKTQTSTTTPTKTVPPTQSKKMFEGIFDEPLPKGTKTINFKYGGAYNQNPADPNQVINTRHTTYGGLPEKPGFERNDIFPVSLGGTNTATSNVEYEPAKEAAYRDKVEKYMAQQYKSGKIDLTTARNNVLSWKETSIPGQVAWNKKLGGSETVLGQLPSALAGTFKSTTSKVKNIFSDIFNVKPTEQAGGKVKLPPVIPTMINTIKDSIKNADQQIKNVYNLNKQIQSGANIPVSQRIGAGLKGISGLANIPFAPISALFAGADQVPVLGTISKLITLPFDITGDIGGTTAKEAVNALPIPQKDKNNLNDAVEEIGTLTGQIILGGKALGFLQGEKPRLTEKFGENGATDIIDAVQKKAQTPPETAPEPQKGLPQAVPPEEEQLKQNQSNIDKGFLTKEEGQPFIDAKKPQLIELKKQLVQATKGVEEKPLNPQAGFIKPSAVVEDLKNTLEKIKQENESAKFGEKLRSYIVGERDVRVAETNQLRDALKKSLTTQEQEALTFYRDFKGNEAELAKLSNDPNFVKYKPIIDLAIKPTDAMLTADKSITDFGTKIRTEEQGLGILDTSIPDEKYITHLLAPADVEGAPKKGFMGLGRARISRTDPFAKGRTYETVADAIKAGVKVKTINALDALTIRGEKWGVSASTKLFLNQLKDSALGKFGFKGKGSENIPNDWVPADPSNRYFRNTVPFTTAEGKPSFSYQDLYVPPKVADALRPLISTNFTGTLPGFRSTRLFQSYLKTIQLGLSVFHMRALNLTALNNEGLTGLIKSYSNDLSSPEFLSQERDFVQNGGQTPILGRTIEAYRGLVDTSLPTRGEILKSIPGVKQVDAFAKGLSRLTFDIMQRKFKVTDYSLKVAKYISDNPLATEEDLVNAKRSISKEVNASYGGLNWEVLGWSKAAIDFSRFVLLAPDWTFSNMLYNTKYALENNPAGMAARKFWIRSAITGATLTYGLSTLINGKPPKANFTNFTNVYYGKDKNGKDIYQNIFFAGAPNDVVNLINNVADYGVIQGFAQSLAAKASPVIRTAIQALTNRNYLGQTIVPKGSGLIAGTGRALYSYGSSLGPLPFSIQNIASMFLDPKKQYTMPEYITVLMGARPRHVVPQGMRQIPSGKKKGQIVPQTPAMLNRQKLPLWQQITTGKMFQPIKK